MTKRKPIDEFRNEYEWLSNFYPSRVDWDGQIYSTVEHAYQAAKTLDAKERAAIREAATPAIAKKLGRKVKHLHPHWDEMKFKVMRYLLTQKFTLHSALTSALKATGNADIIEGNSWGDTIWGVCDRCGHGENHLGKLLMEVRAKL